MKRLVLGMAAVAALMLALGAGFGGADPGANGAHGDGHGHWFRQVCDTGSGTTAGCDAQVETNSDGTPLAGGGPVGGYGPAQIAEAYSLPRTTAGSSTPTVAIVDAYDDPNAASDLNKFSTQYGLPQCNTSNPCFSKVNQAGGTSYPASNSGWALEISLDIETVHGICPTCNIVLVEANNNSTTSLGAAENEAASLKPAAISNSWGANESSSQLSWDTSYFTHPGTAITASTGDDGYGVEWPASSPTVTAVGGTTLTLNGSGGYGSETAWADGGSGCSSVEAQPSWQTGLGSCTNRSVADVAADADPNTGEAVYDSVRYSGQSGWFQVGGTSLSSPIIASVYALANNTGSINDGSTPYLFGNSGNLHDVMSGSNGSCGNYLCNAGPGYDGPTGVGTPNGVSAFSPGPPTPDFSLSVSGQNGTVNSVTGGSPTYTVTVNPSHGFSDQVALTATTPVGVTASFNLPSTATTSQLTLTVPASFTAGSYPITITGTDGLLKHTVTATLTVLAAGFTLSVSPGSATIGGSGSTNFTVTIKPVNGFDSNVSLSVSAPPRNVTASISPFTVSGGSGASALTVTSTGAKRGNATLTVTAIGGGITHTATASLRVT